MIDHDEQLSDRDAERFELLDRLAHRVPELDLSQHRVEWEEMPDDGSQALLVDGGGVDGGNDGMTFCLYGDDVHALGSLALLVPGYIGCVAIKPDGSRLLLQAMPDTLAQQPPA